MLERLAEADVVFIGEIHDEPSHRAFQVALVNELAQRVPGLVLGLEFFAREDQAFLDALASGRLSDVALRSHVRRAGGYPYRELIHLARQKGVRLVGLNLPRPVVNRVARGGWESLSARERERWPRPSSASGAYRRLVREAYLEFSEHHRAGFENFLTAQTLWDTTMAGSIYEHLEAGGSTPLAVVVGQMHVAHGLGIPARLTGLRPVKSAIVLHAGALDEGPEGFEGPAADFIWYPDSSNVAKAFTKAGS